MARWIARLPGRAVDLVRVVVLAIREFLSDNGLQWAAALSFTTLLALVPLLILAFALLGAFATMVDMKGGIENLLLSQGLPEAAQRAGEEIQGLIERSRQSKTGLGIVGAGFLLLTSLGLYAALERAFNRMWKLRRRRGPLQRFRSFWLVITLGPVLFGTSLYLTARLQGLPPAQRVGIVGEAVDALLLALPFLMTWVTLFLFYVWLPNTKVRTRSALLGAVLAGSAWELAKLGFNAYVANAGNIDRVYGPLGILPIFVLWIYLTWIVGLLGVEVCYVSQHLRAVAAGAAGHGAERGATREMTALGLLLAVYRPFRDGSPPPNLARLSLRLVARSETARELLDDLERAELVRRDTGGLYLPGREASRITLADAVAAVRGLAAAVSDLWETPAGRRLVDSFDAGEERRNAALATVTLADVLDAEAG